jgi:hypothetical protein
MENCDHPIHSEMSVEKHNAKVVLGESPLPNPFAAEGFFPSDDLSPKAKVLRRSHAPACNAA